MDHTCTCNNSTSFEYKNSFPGNGNSCKFANSCMVKLVKSHQMNLFFGGI